MAREGTSARGRQERRRGVALIIAIMVIAVMIVFTSDLILNTRVGLSMAVANRDGVRAEYMTKSGSNLAHLLLTIDQALDLYLASPQGKALEAMGLKSGDSLGDIWGMLNGMPIGGDTADLLGSMQETFKLGAFMDSGLLDQLKFLEGHFTLEVEDEAGKINVNYCAKGRCTEVLLMLEALFSCPAEKLFLENKKLDARRLSYKIKDYIDEKDDVSPESGLGSENDPYERKTPPYKTKNGPLDSPDELYMVDGWDDEMQTVFGRYITLWPFQQTGSEKGTINLNTASRELLMCLFPEARGSCSEKFFTAMKDRAENKAGFVGQGQNIANFLKETFCASTSGQEQDPSNRNDWFSEKSSVFRVKVEGEVGGHRRVLTEIIERVIPEGKENPSASKILFWRLR